MLSIFFTNLVLLGAVATLVKVILLFASIDVETTSPFLLIKYLSKVPQKISVFALPSNDFFSFVLILIE